MSPGMGADLLAYGALRMFNYPLDGSPALQQHRRTSVLATCSYSPACNTERHRETGTDFTAIATDWDRCLSPQILVSLSMFPPEKHSEECCDLRSSTTKTPVLRRTRHVTTSSVTLPPRAPEPCPEVSPSLHWRISCWPLDFPGSSRG